MDYDIGSNFTITEGIAAKSQGAATVYSASIDHKGGIKGAFFISCGTFDTSLVCTLQHSSDDGDSDAFVDEADTTYGNTVSQTFTEAAGKQINVPNPRERYTRVKVVSGGTNVISITNMKGPLDSVAPSS